MDTNILSELIKREPNPNVLRWIDDQVENHLFISVLTLGEIQKGIYKLKDQVRVERLKDWLEHSLLLRFEGRIIPLDQKVALRWGELSGNSEQQGQVLPLMDSLIAATAFAYEMTVVTRNVQDLERCRVPVYNPWEYS